MPEHTNQIENKTNLPALTVTTDKLTALLAEYEWLGDDQKRYNEMHRSDANIFCTLLTILVAMSGATTALFHPEIVYLIIPSLIFVFMSMQLMNIFIVSREAQRRAEIELKINDLLHDNQLMKWESDVATRTIRKPYSVPVLSISGIFMLLFIVFLVFSVKSYCTYGPLTFPLHAIELTIMIFSLFRSK